MRFANGRLLATVFVFALTLVTVVIGPVQPLTAGGCSPGFECPDCVQTFCAKAECPEYCGCLNQCLICGRGNPKHCYSVCEQVMIEFC